MFNIFFKNRFRLSVSNCMGRVRLSINDHKCFQKLQKLPESRTNPLEAKRCKVGISKSIVFFIRIVLNIDHIGAMSITALTLVTTSKIFLYCYLR